MPESHVLVVESDAAFAAQVKAAVEGLGLRAEILADGAMALTAAKNNPPALILLCVELPKMSGYSICNKLKKNPELKNIPLVITSAEATPDIFEQHKKLKTRAEDYLIKPFPMHELEAKIRHLLGLPEGSRTGEFLDATALDAGGEFATELATDVAEAGDLVVAYDEDLPTQVPQLPEEDTASQQLLHDAPTRIVTDGDGSDVDLAFAAIEMPAEEDTSAAPMHVMAPAEAAHERGMVTEGEPISAPEVEALEVGAAGPELELEATAMVLSGQRRKLGLPDLPDLPAAPAGEPIPGLEHAPEPPPRPRSEEFGLPAAPSSARGPNSAQFAALKRKLEDLERDNRRLAEESKSRPALAAEPDPALKRRVQELERENRRLGDELSEARQRASESAASATGGAAPSSAFSRDRELLNLREVINKKEKEILDLKDDLDSKERQILDHKDKVRELERKVRDMDEKLLGVEREMMTANERIQALSQDKDKILERERGVKARLEDAKQEIDKAYAENDSLKSKHKEAAERARAEQAAAVAAKDRELDTLRDQHVGELARIAQEHEAARTELEAEHARDLEQLQQEQQAALAQAAAEGRQALAEADAAHRDEIGAINARHEGELQRLRASQNEELNRLRGENERALAEAQHAAEQRIANQSREHESALAALRAEHVAAVERLQTEQRDEVDGLNERHRRDLEQRDAAHAGEKESLRTEHRAEVERLSAEHASSLEELRTSSAAELERTSEELRSELERERRQHAEAIADREREHAAKLQDLEQRHRDRVAGMESRHRSACDELEGRIRGLDDQVAQLSGDLGRSEEELRAARGEGARLEIELQSTQETLSDREQTIREIEARVASLEGQLLKAFNKIKSDELLAEKAKRAMAIAVTLLEEQKKVAAAGEQPQQEQQ
jgi:DNA-binding response OmpR family regulator/chromosome segregation ATPase